MDEGYLALRAHDERAPGLEVELCCRILEQPVELGRDGHGDQRGAIGLGTGLELVGTGHTARAGNVAHDDGGVAGQMLAKLAREIAAIDVRGPARLERNDDLDPLTGEIDFAVLRLGHPGHQGTERQRFGRRLQKLSHRSSPFGNVAL